MELAFNTHGNTAQKEAAGYWIDAETLEILYAGTKGAGKSYLGCSLIFGDALIYPGTHYFIARKRLKDIQRFTIPTIHEVFEHWGLKVEDYMKLNGQYNYYQLHNGSRVYLLDCSHLPSDPMFERFGSMSFTRGWIEEAGEVSHPAKNNLQASLGRWKNDDYDIPAKLLLTCNPSKNFLYATYYKPFRDGNLPSHRKFVKALPEHNKRLPANYVSNLLLTLTANEIERLVRGNWEFDDDPALLCTYDAICDAFTNTHADSLTEGVPSGMSTDLARKGRDKWTVWHWRHNVAKLIKITDWAEADGIQRFLEAKEKELSVPRSRVVSDSDGLGQYLGDYMKGIFEFMNGGRAFDPKYANLKTECAYKLASLIEDRRLRIECPEEVAELLREELGQLKVENIDTDTQKRKLVSKDIMKENLGRSPDLLDGLLYGMIFWLKKQYKGMRTGATRGKPGTIYGDETPQGLRT